MNAQTASEVILAGMGDTPEATAYCHDRARNASFATYCRSLGLIEAMGLFRTQAAARADRITRSGIGA